METKVEFNMTNSEDIIYKETMVNAYKYGSADAKIVMKKIMSGYPELRSKAKEIQKILGNIVNEVNNLSRKDLEKIVEDRYPESIIEKEVKERDYLPEIVNAKKGEVKVRYPPEPSKEPHIGQMLSFCINHLIAERFEGRTVLRFDDTNPEKVRSEFYDSFREVLAWLNLRVDEEVLASDKMEVFYEKARKLILDNDAFVCRCERKLFTQLRDEQKECTCNLNNSTELNLELFEEILEGKFSPGEAVVRLRGDMKSPNSVMRDPVLLRLSSHTHCIQGDKYILWPMYDFESPIMEDLTQVTHILRSMEFGKMRQELQTTIAKRLNLNVPEFMEYRRYNIIGAPTQGRVIRELVKENIVTGWDDYRLVTYQAMKRRGIQPEVFPEIIKRVGATKSSTNIDFSLIFSINRKIIEPNSRHCFFVEDPIKVLIINPIKRSVDIPYHPHNQELGKRIINVDDVIYLSGTDKEFLNVNSNVRLKDLYNIRITEKIAEKELRAEITGIELQPDYPKLQWVSEPVEVEIVKPEMLYLNKRINKDSLKYIQGLGENSLKKLKIDEIIQLERFGYTKVNKINNQIKMNYIHG